MANVPFTVSKLVHNNLTHLMSANDDKFDFVDANRIPYAVKFNPVIENFFTVADENGFIKFFSSYPSLKPIKEISAQKSCIYDLHWLNSHEIACGGGDQHVSIFDVNTCVRLAILKGHTESVKSITQLASSPFVIASGSRDGSVLIFDVRFNRTSDASDPNVSYIRAVNSIQKAHFVEDPSSSHGTKSAGLSTINNRFLNVLKSKSSNSASPSKTAALQQASRRASPVASVLFQSEHLLISAGATDGLIKVWDTRKIYSCSNSKKYIDQSPLYIFDNHMKTAMNHAPGTGKSKGYSNIIMNNAGTRLYANCLNSFIYEYNYQTYNQSHTRILNSTNIQKYHSSQASKPPAPTPADGDKPKSRYHTNQSNFIKSKISQCDNYILTGSSDFNAYIYPTNANSDCDSYRKHMPVIVLKGHTNEVTAVDWNPINSNQLVTCSDDNTIRLWNVKREIDMLRANECNFCLAETIDEFEDETEGKRDESAYNLANDRSNVMPMIRNRKYAPFYVGCFDDLMFTNYEYRNFIKRTSPDMDKKQNDLEAELCKKWSNINIGTAESQLRQPKSSRSNEFHSSASNSNESSFLENDAIEAKISEFVILQLDTLTSNMPINIISEEEKNLIHSNSQSKVETNKPDKGNFFKRQSSKSMLLSSASASSTVQAKTSTVRNKPLRQQKLESSPESKMKIKEHATPRQGLKKMALSTAKKRNALQSGLLQGSDADGLANDEPRTPVSKRRLIMCDSVSNSPSTPKNTGNGPTAAVNSPIRSILHYFSPKPAQK